ncbi:hypothetical protein FKM82_000857 [Ascaphus truei]
MQPPLHWIARLKGSVAAGASILAPCVFLCGLSPLSARHCGTQVLRLRQSAYQFCQFCCVVQRNEAASSLICPDFPLVLDQWTSVFFKTCL